MRAAFLLLCVICAGLVSTMLFVFQTGKIPFRPDAVPSESTEPQSKVIEEGLSVAENERKSMEELIQALNAERSALDKQKAELASREENVKLKEVAVASLKNDVEKLQKDLESRISEVKSTQQANCRHLADMYSKMDPASASILLKDIDRSNAAVILSMITERSAAAIMDATIQAGGTNAAVVAEWTDIIRNMKMEKTVNKAKE